MWQELYQQAERNRREIAELAARVFDALPERKRIEMMHTGEWHRLQQLRGKNP